MTKYEWECELKKNIHRLPDAEIKRVLEYYTELFMDKAERGYTENAIISEFGNPVDVADKILSDFYVEKGGKTDKEYTEVYSYKDKGAKSEWTENAAQAAPKSEKAVKVAEQSKSNKKQGHVSGGRLAVFIVLTVILGGVVLGVMIGLWATFIGLAIGGVGCIVAGAGMVIPVVIQTMGNFYVMLAQVGLCIAAAGIGILMVIVSGKLSKFAVYLTKKMFAMFKDFLVVKNPRYQD